MANNALLVSADFPAQVAEGAIFSATVTMRNVGDTTWTPESEYKLGVQDPAIWAQYAPLGA